MSPLAPPAASLDPNGIVEDFGPVHQAVTNESRGNNPEPHKKDDPDKFYNWHHYYEAPKWKDFRPSSALADRISSAPPPPPRRFKDATPGEVMRNLLHEAHARGAVLEIGHDFSDDRDSAGKRWSTKAKDLITHKFKAGRTLLQVAQWMHEQGFAEARMHHRTLQLFIPGSGDDLTGDVLLAQGRNLVDGKVKSTAVDLASHALVLSESGVHGWVMDEQTYRKYGRIEALQSINSVKTWDQAEERGKRYLDRVKDPRQQFNYGIVPDRGANPYKNFKIGDYIFVIQHGLPKKHRVRQIALSWDANGAVLIGVTLSDVLLSHSVKADRRAQARDGRTISINDTFESAEDATTSDELAPNAPSIPKVVSRAGSVKITWDGHDLFGHDPVWDQDHIEVHLSTEPDFDPTRATLLDRMSGPGSVHHNDLPYGTDYFVRFVAVDAAGDASPPSEEVIVNMVGVTGGDIADGSVGADQLDPGLPIVTDGFPPPQSSAPDMRGGLNAMFIQWPGVVNADAVSYDVHMSTVDGFIPDASTLITTTTSTLVAARTLADGTPLIYDVPGSDPVVAQIYYARIVAFDADGAAPPSAEGQGSISRTGVDDIAVGSITAEKLAAVIILASKIASSVAGARWEGDNDGIRVYDSSGNIVANFPTNGNVYLNADVYASSLTVADSLSIRGTNNEFARGSSTLLASGVTAPKTSPTVTIGWDYDDLPAIDSDIGYTAGWVGSPDLWTVVQNGATSTILRYNLAGVLLDSHTLPAQRIVVGIVRNAARVFVLFVDLNRNGRWFINNFNASSWSTPPIEWEYLWTGSVGYQPALGFDGTNLMVADCAQSTGKVRIQRYTTGGAPVGGQITLDSASVPVQGLGCGLAGVVYGAFDGQTTSYYVVAAEDSQTPGGMRHKVWAFSLQADGKYGYNDGYSFVSPSKSMRGFMHDGTQFRTFTPEGLFYKHTSILWTTGSGTRAITYTWRDQDATGGTHETTQSPPFQFSMKKRARYTITVPPIPDLGGTDDPDSINIYIGTGSGGRLTQWLNASPAVGVSTVNLSTEIFTGSNPPSSNSFPAAAPSQLQLSDGVSYIKGDGSVNLPGLVPAYTTYTPSWTSTGTAPSIGNGTLSGRYQIIGKRMFFDITMVIGSTTSLGTGGYAWSLPSGFPARFVNGDEMVGVGKHDDINASSNPSIPRFAGLVTSTSVAMWTNAGGRVSAGSPVVPETGDVFVIHGNCELA